MHELLNTAHLRYPLLMDHTTNGNHGKSSIHNLIRLILLEDSRVLTQSKRVKSKIPRFTVSLKSLLECIAADTFEGNDEHKDLAHTSGTDEVVVGVNREHVREIGMGDSPELLH